MTFWVLFIVIPPSKNGSRGGNTFPLLGGGVEEGRDEGSNQISARGELGFL